ncbi:hypothetical protein NE865_10677 [Phthorimaea operculella]|nr:hypothetical protein NE865_10677 [Phthorimaea operculella]
MCTSNANKNLHTGQNPNDKPCKILKGIALNMIKHIFLWVRAVWSLIIDTIFSFIWDGTRQKIPDLDQRHQILSESAVSLAAKIRNRELKSADLVGASIERIKAHFEKHTGIDKALPQTVCSLIVTWKHIRAPYDAECVELLKAAGGICVAVTNIPEICKCIDKE